MTASTADRSGDEVLTGGDVHNKESSRSFDWPSVLASVGEYLEGLNSSATESPVTSTENESTVADAGRAEGSADAMSPASSISAGPDGETGQGESSESDATDSATPNTEVVAQIELINVAENGYAVGFLLAGQTVTLKPGERREVTESPVTVRFDRGGQFGSATKTLTAGHYEFRLSKNGWDLIAEAQ